MTTEQLYDFLNVDYDDQNPFYSDTNENKLDDLRDKISAITANDNKQYDVIISCVYDLIELEQKNAFTVGFDTAVSLILGHVNKK